MDIQKTRARVSNNKEILFHAFVIIAFLVCFPIAAADTTPPQSPVKLVFIHHSVGENWLTDDNGALGRTLGENNYFVSDTYYGWGPDGIGDRTDIVDWPEWFTGPRSDIYLRALYQESSDDAAGWDYYNRPMEDPGGENEIVIFKSCFPNSDLGGNPDDPPGDGPDMTVGGAKFVYNQILGYFRDHPEKLFIAVTPPPEISDEHAAQAESFSTWLTTRWLNGYSGTNVGVFDLHAVLSSPDNHHTAEGDTLVYETGHGNTLAYPTEDAHPSVIGNRKATAEFVPLLNYYYNRWNSGRGSIQIHPAETPEIRKQLDTIDHREEPASPLLVTATLQPALTKAPVSGKISGNWVTYDDGYSKITLKPGEDSSGFCADTDVLPGGWVSVETLFEDMQDWSGYSGISYQISADRPGVPYSLTLYSMNDPDMKNGYQTSKMTPASDSQSSEREEISWSDFSPLESSDTYDPNHAGGLFFSFGGENPVNLSICVNNLTLIP